MSLTYSDLVYSKDDDDETGAGWYWDGEGKLISQLFATEGEARDAEINGEIIWSNP